MRILVLSDNADSAEKVRQIVSRSGYECRSADIVPLSMAADFAARARRDVAVLVTSADEGKTLAALRDLCSLSATRVLAVGPTKDSKFLLQVLRDGAAEFIDEHEMEAELPRGLVRIKDRRSPASTGGMVIGVLGASGGSGTTTVAANLAVALAAQPQSRGVALCDLRVGAGDLSLLFDVKPSYSLADLCQNCDRMDQNMVRQSMTVHSSGVHLLAASKAGELDTGVTPRGVRQTIATARTLFPFVVLDLDRTFSPEQLSAIVQADILLLVMRLDIMSLHNTSRAISALENLGFGKDRLRLVVNRYRQRKELPPSMVEQALGMKLSDYLLDDPGLANSSANTGVPLVLTKPRSKVARNITSLAADLARLRGPESEQGHTDVENSNLNLKSAAAFLY